MARLTGFEPATFGSGVIGARGINNLHREPSSATELYFQGLARRCVHSVALHQCRGSPQISPHPSPPLSIRPQLSRGSEPTRVWGPGCARLTKKLKNNFAGVMLSCDLSRKFAVLESRARMNARQIEQYRWPTFLRSCRESSHPGAARSARMASR